MFHRWPSHINHQMMFAYLLFCAATTKKPIMRYSRKTCTGRNLQQLMSREIQSIYKHLLISLICSHTERSNQLWAISQLMANLWSKCHPCQICTTKQFQNLTTIMATTHLEILLYNSLIFKVMQCIRFCRWMLKNLMLVNFWKRKSSNKTYIKMVSQMVTSKAKYVVRLYILINSGTKLRSEEKLPRKTTFRSSYQLYAQTLRLLLNLQRWIN